MHITLFWKKKIWKKKIGLGKKKFKTFKWLPKHVNYRLIPVMFVNIKNVLTVALKYNRIKNHISINILKSRAVVISRTLMKKKMFFKKQKVKFTHLPHKFCKSG